MRVRHVAIVVRDMEKMLAFYQSLGFEVLSDTTEDVRIIKLHDGDGAGLELLRYESQSENSLRKKGISHVAFTCDPEGNYVEVVNNAI